MFIVLIVVCIGLWNGQQIRDFDWDRGIGSEIPMNDQALIDQVASVDDPKPVPVPVPDPSPSDKPAAKEIIIHMGVNCPPCEKWKRCELSRFQEAGWKVAICDPSQHSYSRTPTFSITIDGKKIEKTGYIQFEEIDEVVK